MRFARSNLRCPTLQYLCLGYIGKTNCIFMIDKKINADAKKNNNDDPQVLQK